MNTAIVIFAYNRPELLNRLLLSLSRSDFISDYPMFLYCDYYAKRPEVSCEIYDVYNAYKGLFRCSEFYMSRVNNGLASQVIHGVSEVLLRYDSVIVLEDDLIADESLINYFIACLSIYKNDERIFNINGYSAIRDADKPLLFLSTRLSSWGWAIWKDRWFEIDWSRKLRFRELNIFRICVDGLDLLMMMMNWNKRKIDSWAIRAYYHQHINKLYSVSCTYSFIENGGINMFATHTKSGLNRYSSRLIESKYRLLKYPKKIVYQRRWNHSALRPFSIHSIMRAKLCSAED